MKLQQRWIAAALVAGLLLPALAGAQSVVQHGQSFRQVLQGQAIIGVYWPDTTARLLDLDNEGALSVNALVTNPAVLNYVPNAMGPTTHRENNGGAPWVASYARDSTTAIPLQGGTRVGIWFNCLPDTTVDSLGVIHWYALGVRMCLTAGVDSTTSSPWLPFVPGVAPITVGNVTAYAASFQQLVLSGTGAAAINVATNLLPGEILIPLQVTANGVGASRYIEINLAGQTFGPEYVMFTLRSFGHWDANPQSIFLRLPIYKTKVRADVLVLK